MEVTSSAKYALEVLGRKKKPSAESPLLEMIVSPTKSGFAYVSADLHLAVLHSGLKNRRMENGNATYRCGIVADWLGFTTWLRPQSSMPSRSGTRRRKASVGVVRGSGGSRFSRWPLRWPAPAAVNRLESQLRGSSSIRARIA